VRTVRQRAATVCLVVLALAVAGCSEDRERPSETLPTSSEAPTSETPTATTGPNGVVPSPVPNSRFDEQSEIGAIAFNEYWTMTLDYLYATLEVEPFRGVSAPECTFCAAVLEQEGRDEEGYVYQGGRITIEGSVVNSFEGTEATVTTIVSITELIVTDPQGNRHPDSGPAQPRFQLVNYLSWTGEGWVVIDANGGRL